MNLAEIDLTESELYRKGFGFYPEYDDDGGADTATCGTLAEPCASTRYDHLATWNGPQHALLAAEGWEGLGVRRRHACSFHHRMGAADAGRGASEAASRGLPITLLTSSFPGDAALRVR